MTAERTRRGQAFGRGIVLAADLRDKAFPPDSEEEKVRYSAVVGGGVQEC